MPLTNLRIKSYLSNRMQSCLVDGELSASVDLLDCGVPQGSIGGPLLWLCFTCDQPDVIHDHLVDGNDLHRGCGEDVEAGDQAVEQGESSGSSEVECGELVGYVDDGAKTFSHREPAVLSRVLTEKYTLLETWMNANKLVINQDKTHLMVMGSKKTANLRQHVSMQAGAFVIKPTESEKMLGGQLHQTLQWNHHLHDSKASLVRQLTSRVNELKRISKNATFQTRLMVANGVVMSKMVYLITLWGGAQQYLLKVLLVQQLTAAKAVCGFQSWGWSKKKLMDKVGWISVRQLIYFHTVLQTHKTLTTGVPRSLHASLPTIYPYRTRNSTIGKIRFGDYFTSTATFKYRAMSCYNGVPGEVMNVSLPTVKKKLKQWVQQNVPIDWG